MNLASVSVDKSAVVGFAMVLLTIAGLAAYFGLGQLEDPEFTIKNATVVTFYPGASAEEVELEVTDRIEMAVQKLPYLEKVESVSRPGLSIVKVEVLPQYRASQLPQIWNELRRKVRDVEPELPPGCGTPDIGDDFGDVYGFLMAVTGDGFTYEELEDYVDEIKKELSLVQGVARVELWGVPDRCIYLDVSETRLSQLGLKMQDIQNTLSEQNLVVDSGNVDLGDERLRIEQTGDFSTTEEIADLAIRSRERSSAGGAEELLRIRDIAEVRRGSVEPVRSRLRYRNSLSGELEMPAIGIAVSNRSGVNVVELGRNLDASLAELSTALPVGVEVHRISWQATQVDESIDVFLISLLESVAIVVVVLWLFMGLPTATVVGLSGLALTIVGTFVVMYLTGIDLQRMSLGALVIAMGMMVDNAIVVADGVLVRLQRGMDRRQAAIEAATAPAMPLLGATTIAVLAFYPIYASLEDAGEYCASLFQVVAISLLLSWVLSVTATPLLCIWILPQPKTSAAGESQYDGYFYRAFRRVLEFCLRFRWAAVAVLCACLAGSLALFPLIDKTFFPDSARLQLMVDYWAPEGTAIESVSRDMKTIEKRLLAQPGVESISSFVGAGPPRFYLPVDPEPANPSYGQFIVNLDSLDHLNELVLTLDPWLRENVPQAETVVRRYGLGPSNTWTVELRVAGPSSADAATLREVAGRVEAIFRESPTAAIVRTNWRQRTKRVVAEYSQEQARWTAVSRIDVASASRRAYDGLPIGLYREEDKLYPIIARQTEAERRQFLDQIELLQVQSSASGESIPLAQVTSSVAVDSEEAEICRHNRRRTITVQARTHDGVPASRLREHALPQIDALRADLPPGFRIEWGGEYEDSLNAQLSLIPGMIPAGLLMALILVGLFNDFRPPLVIVAAVPFAVIGVTIGLLALHQPLGFVALLGVMSLSGMMIKNAIVLLDEINALLDQGRTRYEAIVGSALSRLRPVGLAAATTVLGVIPLLPDVFWVSMGVAIMFGLAVGTAITMIGVPVIYACIYRVPMPREEAP